MIRVEKGIPVGHVGPGRPAIYPFHQLGVGESFLFPPHVDIKLARANASAAVPRLFGKNSGVRFLCKETTRGVRCWRVE